MNIRTALPALVATIGLAAFTAGCSSDSKSAATTAAPVTTAAPAATTAATAAPTTAATTAPAASSADTTAGSTASSGAATGGSAVAIAGFKFGPPEIDVKVGDTVTWTNNDKQPHTATSAGAFDTGSIAPGATGTATFSKAGTFEYICSFHPFMKGKVVVS
ncbi:MAG: hypothetical protein JWL72_201 [Ilumatobacteraceae bacterium]|nr:hypothetical protein [Ilumatobacteraceae bacterium]